jgi:hypothetical protein
MNRCKSESLRGKRIGFVIQKVGGIIKRFFLRYTGGGSVYHIQFTSMLLHAKKLTVSGKVFRKEKIDFL